MMRTSLTIALLLSLTLAAAVKPAQNGSKGVVSHDAGKWDLGRLKSLAGDPFPFSVCAGAPTDLAIAHVDVTPDPPAAGQNITISADGSVDEQLTQGSQVVISVNFMGIQIFSDTIPMSDVTSMPIGPGPVNIQYSIGIPEEVPHGPYSVSLTFNDQTGTEITCILVSFSL